VIAKEKKLPGKHKKPPMLLLSFAATLGLLHYSNRGGDIHGQNFLRTKLPQSSSLVIGIIGLLLVGYAFFSGSLGSDSISGSVEPVVE